MTTSTLCASDQRAIAKAMQILQTAWQADDHPPITSSSYAKQLLALRLGVLDREEFHACWLNSGNRLLAIETISVGTLDQTAVYPREVIKSALRHNAAAVIVAHNHPGGTGTPSKADIHLTQTLQDALSIFGIRLLDHIIIAGAGAHSMREFGEING